MNHSEACKKFRNELIDQKYPDCEGCRVKKRNRGYDVVRLINIRADKSKSEFILKMGRYFSLNGGNETYN